MVFSVYSKIVLNNSLQKQEPNRALIYVFGKLFLKTKWCSLVLYVFHDNKIKPITKRVFCVYLDFLILHNKNQFSKTIKNRLDILCVLHVFLNKKQLESNIFSVFSLFFLFFKIKNSFQEP